MKSSDLEYLFENIPYTEKNIYPQDIEIENVAMFKDSMKNHGYNYEYEKLDTGFMSANLLRSEEHTSELQSRGHLVCRLLLEKKNCYLGLSIIRAYNG